MIYQVDCVDRHVENVIPTYAGGYGVGQMLPSAYSYYNVPYQYRSITMTPLITAIGTRRARSTNMIRAAA